MSSAAVISANNREFTAVDLIAELEAFGCFPAIDEDGDVAVSNPEDLTEDLIAKIANLRPELTEILSDPIERAGRSKGERWRESLGPIGRALNRVMRHAGACGDCARGAGNGCERGRDLYAKWQELR